MNKRRPLRILLVLTLFIPPAYILLHDYWPYLCRFTSIDFCPSTFSSSNVTFSNATSMELILNSSEDLYGDSSCGDNPNRAVLHQLFRHWVNISAQHKITYFLTTGSLLGAWRNADIIPYDRDVDILVANTSGLILESLKDKRNFLRNDTKIRLVLQEDWRKPYAMRRRFMCYGKLVQRYRDHCSFQEPLGRLVSGDHHLDIYDYQLIDGYVVDLSEWEKRWLYADIFPLSVCSFMGLSTWCPRRPTAVLSAFYGDDLSSSRKCRNGSWVITRNVTNA